MSPPAPDTPDPPDPREIGRRLAEIRRKLLDLQQEDLAERLGVSVSAVRRWEQGKVSMPVAPLCQIAWMAGVSIDWIVRPVDTKCVWLIDQEHVDLLLDLPMKEREENERPLWRVVDEAGRVVRTRAELRDLWREVTGDEELPEWA